MTTTIVCVDDDERILTLVKRVLVRPELEIRITTDPEQVLTWVAEDSIAVLVSDYDMPAITGAQLAGRVRRMRPETVRILLTGQRSLETAVDGINQGEVFRFISKPFEPEALRKAVADAIERHEELVELSGARAARARRIALRAALEHEHPGISQVAFDERGNYRVSSDVFALAAELGIKL